MIKGGFFVVIENRIGEWTDMLASKAPVPGGGGASAFGGALAAALGQMVANLTIGKKKFADVEDEIKEYCETLRGLQADMLGLIERDAKAFAPLAAAYSMPKDTEEQRAEKDRVMEENLLAASLVPMEIMEKANEILEVVDQLEQKGSRMAVSDAGVAAQFARAALNGAVMNVYINTKSMKNREKAEELNAKARKLIEIGESQADAIYARVLEKLV
jgi:formiminotetrahydrofolate cyclodeaminase